MLKLSALFFLPVLLTTDVNASSMLDVSPPTDFNYLGSAPSDNSMAEIGVNKSNDEEINARDEIVKQDNIGENND